jgi:2-polyprenyl-3-methyl-5-hydroxy-6-metoxy-1,4-benzoquinol methylase
MQKMNKSEKFWDRVANQSAEQTNKIDETYLKTIDNTKKYLKPGDIVMDYACGTGIITNEIAHDVKEIYAIDSSSRMIEVAKSKAGERNIENINFEQSTIFDVRNKNESFNVITAFNILHLLEDLHEVLQKVNELLKPGGLFISATPCLGETNRIIGILIFLVSKIGIVPNVKMLKFSDLEGLIAGGNFIIVETESLHHTQPNYFILARKSDRR